MTSFSSYQIPWSVSNDLDLCIAASDMFASIGRRIVKIEVQSPPNTISVRQIRIDRSCETILIFIVMAKMQNSGIISKELRIPWIKYHVMLQLNDSSWIATTIVSQWCHISRFSDRNFRTNGNRSSPLAPIFFRFWFGYLRPDYRDICRFRQYSHGHRRSQSLIW